MGNDVHFKQRRLDPGGVSLLTQNGRGTNKEPR
jgi:hypothetical protein